MRASRLDALGLGGKHCVALRHLAGELVVSTLPIGQLAVVEMQDPLHSAVQKPPVVADDDDRMGVFLQIAFKPERAFEVKIVGRLVKQQIVRLRKQHARQRHAHPPAAREI